MPKVNFTMHQTERELEQNVFNNFSSDIDLIGGSKAEKDKVKVFKPPEKMDVEDVQGNQVKIV